MVAATAESARVAEAEEVAMVLVAVAVLVAIQEMAEVAMDVVAKGAD
jgi:hypothetical protein